MVANLRALASKEVLVGYPAESAARDPVDGKATNLTNAAIGYINENGDPDLNIPARPHLGPGIAKNLEGIEARLQKAARAATKAPGSNQADQLLHEVGAYAQAAVRKEIMDGLEPPLADATLRARANRVNKKSRAAKAARHELNARSQGYTLDGMVKPLIDSGQLRNAINYVIRNKSERSQ